MELFLVVFILAIHQLMCIACQQQCGNNPSSVLQGNVFPGFGFNDTESATNTTTPHVYGCRHLCKYDPGCVALHFLESQGARPNCFLRSSDLGLPALSRKASSFVIIFDTVENPPDYAAIFGSDMPTGTPKQYDDAAETKLLWKMAPLNAGTVVETWHMDVIREHSGSLFLFTLQPTGGLLEVVYRQDYHLTPGYHTISSESSYPVQANTYFGWGCYQTQGGIAYYEVEQNEWKDKNTGGIPFVGGTVQGGYKRMKRYLLAVNRNGDV